MSLFDSIGGFLEGATDDYKSGVLHGVRCTVEVATIASALGFSIDDFADIGAEVYNDLLTATGDTR